MTPQQIAAIPGIAQAIVLTTYPLIPTQTLLPYGTQVTFVNTGNVPVYVRIADDGVPASIADSVIAAGDARSFSKAATLYKASLFSNLPNTGELRLLPATAIPAAFDANGIIIGGAGVAWASKPAANSVPVGTQIVINDVGAAGNRTTWWSDGTIWRPLNGVATLWNLAGSVTAPLASITSAGSALAFGAPLAALKIPAGMLVPRQSILRISANWVKTGAGGGGNCIVTLGTSISFSDSQSGGQAIATGSMWPMSLDIAADTTGRISTTPPTLGVNVAGASGSQEGTANINTNADMFLNFGSTSLASGDTMTLTKLNIQLFH